MLGPIMIIGILIGLLELLICVFIAASIRSKSKSNIEEKPKANAGSTDRISPSQLNSREGFKNLRKSLLSEFHILSVLKKDPNSSNNCSYDFANIASAGF